MNKKIIKGIIGVVLFLSLAIALTGCGSNEEKVKQYAKETEKEVSSKVQELTNEINENQETIDNKVNENQETQVNDKKTENTKKVLSDSEAYDIVKKNYDVVKKNMSSAIKKIEVKEINGMQYSGEVDSKTMESIKAKFTDKGFKEFLEINCIHKINNKYYVEDGIGSADPTYLSHGYSVKNVSDNKITVSLNVKCDDSQSPTKKYEINLVKEGNNWLINNYPYVV